MTTNSVLTSTGGHNTEHLRRQAKKTPERAAELIRTMSNKELNNGTTEEQRTILKAKFERQPVNIQHDFLENLECEQNKNILVQGTSAGKN